MAEFMAIEVAEYIERGLAAAERPEGGFRVLESPLSFLHLRGSSYYAGVLGLAFIGKVGDPEVALGQWLGASTASPTAKLQVAARLLGVSTGLARLVELNHRNGVPAAEIALSLRIGTLGLSFRSRPFQPHFDGAETSSDSGCPAGFQLETVPA